MLLKKEGRTMPKLKDGYRQLATQVPGHLMDGLDRLSEETGRSVAVEIAHAIERHLAAPPVVRVETPPLAAAEAETGPGHKKRGPKSRKES